VVYGISISLFKNLISQNTLQIIILLLPILLSLLVIVSCYLFDFYDSYSIGNVLSLKGKEEKTNYFVRGSKLESEIILKLHNKGSYFLIMGEHGCGKSTIMQHLANQNEGLIYLSCPESPYDFGKEFARTIGYSSIFEPSLLRKIMTSSLSSVLPTAEKLSIPMAEYVLSKKKFLEKVHEYKLKNNQPVILIIDDINRFCTKDDDDIPIRFLLELQSFAKTCAVSINIYYNLIINIYLFVLLGSK